MLPMPRPLLILIVTAYCGFLLPCSLCFVHRQYEVCENTSTCGGIYFEYPFGIGNKGCGGPNFQIDCVHNSNPVITLERLNYTILSARFDEGHIVIVRQENCQFRDMNFKVGYKYAGEVFNISGTANWTVILYHCSPPISRGFYLPFNECNASLYYALYENGNSIPGCPSEPVMFNVGIVKWVSDNTKTDISCKSCKASGGICGYNSSFPKPAAPFVCYCKDGARTYNCSHGINMGAVLGGSIGGFMFLVAGLFVGRAVYRRKMLCFREVLVVMGDGDCKDKDIEADIKGKIGSLPIFSYEVLKQATNDFDEKNQLGDGGFGSVYLGKLWDGRAVAVKRMYQDNCRRFHQFINEIIFMGNGRRTKA